MQIHHIQQKILKVVYVGKKKTYIGPYVLGIDHAVVFWSYALDCDFCSCKGGFYTIGWIYSTLRTK